MFTLVIIKPALLVVIVKNFWVAIRTRIRPLDYISYVLGFYLRYAFFSHSKFNCDIIGHWRLAFLMIRGLPMSAYLRNKCNRYCWYDLNNLPRVESFPG